MNAHASRLVVAVSSFAYSLLYGYGAFAQPPVYQNRLHQYYPGMASGPQHNVRQAFENKIAQQRRMFPQRKIVITDNEIIVGQPLYRQLPTSPNRLDRNSPIYYLPTGTYLAYPTQVSVPGAQAWTDGEYWGYSRRIGGPGSRLWWAE